MKVWDTKSPGYTELLTLEDDLSEDEDISCDRKDVFKVTKSGTGRTDNWEKSIKDVKLTLENCEKDSKVEKCDINIEQSVGLGWNPQFKPKAIFK